MSEVENASPRARRAPAREFFTHVATMPPWHRKLFIAAGALAVLGLIGQAVTRVSHAQPAPAEVTVTNGTSSAPRSSFVDSSSSATTPPPPAAAAQSEPTMTQRLSLWATRVGVGFIGGFIIGWAFRAFLKTMALVTVAGVALIWTLSHFNVLKLDMNVAEERWKTGTSWVSDKAEQLKDSAAELIPSSASSVFGMFLGFRRK
jgi:uncharacterized membrane protein (Fun14 family)